MSKATWLSHLRAVAGSIKRSDPAVIEHVNKQADCKDCYARRRTLRANRNRRERDQAMRNVGLVKTPFGWE